MSHNLCLNKMIQSFESYHNGESETNRNIGRSRSEQYLKNNMLLGPLSTRSERLSGNDSSLIS